MLCVGGREGGLDAGFAPGKPVMDGVAPAYGGIDGAGGGRLIAGPGVNTPPGRKRTSTAGMEGIEGVDGIDTPSGGFFGVDMPKKSLRSRSDLR